MSSPTPPSQRDSLGTPKPIAPIRRTPRPGHVAGVKWRHAGRRADTAQPVALAAAAAPRLDALPSRGISLR
jgi:hypothetical protein